MSEIEINDYLSKCDKDLANNIIYRVYGMPGPIFMENDTPTPGPEPPTPPTPSTSTPFYVENITNSNETLLIRSYDFDGGDNYLKITVEYSTDGTGWSTLGTTGATPLTKTLQPGDKVYLKATTNAWYEFEGKAYSHGCTINGVSKVGGNIMSLLYGSNFTGNERTLPSGTNANFGRLFIDNEESDDWTNTVLVSASELLLPATTLTDWCYESMFSGCTSLTTAPELPATTLAESCYYEMFNSCTSLITTPALPATTLAEYCYQNMFSGCTSLTTAPTLPATTLAETCYQNMFSGCDSLNYIECLATDISASDCTTDWVQGVAATGTFVKDPNMSGWTTGNNGIPDGWTVQDATN